MPVKLYSTLSRKKEELKTMEEGKVGIYVCGITAYDSCHVGHARSAVVFDVITRYLRYRGYDVKYVKNFTDIDDKIINRANAEETTITDIAERYIAEHNDDMRALGVMPPTVTPRATEYIEGMIELISRLMDKGLAYAMDGDVYYAVEKFPGYGKLSCRNLDDLLAGARVDVNEKKKNPLDFALWKASKEGEPWWESPWGRGRPGWHIECSVMSSKLLGDTFDIHGGGEDLIFPHHENEIAQSEGATGKSFARYWMHNGFVRVNSEKMSKSLGNFYTIKDMLKHYHPDVLRYFMIQTHYRNPVDFSADSFAEARQGLERCYSTLKALKDVLAGRTDIRQFAPDQLSDRASELDLLLVGMAGKFREAMDDDFNTARAMGHIFEMVRLINSFMAEKGFAVSDESLFVLDRARRTLLELGNVFALFLVDPDEYLTQDRNREAEKQGIDIGRVDRLIEERWKARAAKDWQKADEIRQQLAAMKVVLKDSPSGTTWKIG